MSRTNTQKVFPEIRGDRIFLCIAPPYGDPSQNDWLPQEMARTAYSIEREIKPDCTPEKIQSLIAEMAQESGMALEPSAELLRELLREQPKHT
jgi:hypothetical protein